jgi:hypothetical protein
VAKVLASEIAMLYYTLWARKKEPLPRTAFTCYHENGITALYGTLLFVATIELFIVHLLLRRWHETIAWVLTLASFYATIQILGHIRAIRRRYSEIKGERLWLKYGLFGDMLVELRHIQRAEFTRGPVAAEGKKVEHLALLKTLESHNVAIYFSTRQKIETAYGFTKECDIVLLHLDNRAEFVERLNQALARSSNG